MTSKIIIPSLAAGDTVEITWIDNQRKPLEVFKSTVTNINVTPGADTAPPSGRYVGVIKDGKSIGTWEARISKHTPSPFNYHIRNTYQEQNRFLKQHGYEWYFYSAQFAEDNDDFSGAGNEWILYGPDGRAVDVLTAYRRIFNW